MITRDNRPKTYAQVLHQELPKAVLKAISKDPEGKPQAILLCGSLGTGKTTLAKIFVRAVNCQSGTGDVCNKCPSCSKNLEAEGLYREYDSSVIGNVASIRQLRDDFGFSAVKGTRVIVFDECQVCSKESQSALLKVLEEPPSNTFFVFCTTDPDMLLDPLRSRCLELSLTTAPPEVALKRVEDLCAQYGIDMAPKDKAFIVTRSGGHFRNIDMLVNLHLIVGAEEFSLSAKSAVPLFRDLFVAILARNNDAVAEVLAKLHQYPLVHLKEDFEAFLFKTSRQWTLNRAGAEPFVTEMGARVFSVAKYYATVGQYSFGSDHMFESYVWSLVALMGAK